MAKLYTLEARMMCPPHTAFVPKYGQKLTALGEFLGYWQLQARSCCRRQECKAGMFGTIFLLEILSKGGVWRERNEAFRIKQE